MTTETDHQKATRAWHAVAEARAVEERAIERLRRTQALLRMGAADEAEVAEAEAKRKAAYEAVLVATNAAELRSRMAG